MCDYFEKPATFSINPALRTNQDGERQRVPVRLAPRIAVGVDRIGSLRRTGEVDMLDRRARELRRPVGRARKKIFQAELVVKIHKGIQQGQQAEQRPGCQHERQAPPA